MEYGTGAIMARARARRARLRVRQALRAADQDRRRARRRRGSEKGGAFVPHSDDEKLVESAQFSGMPSPEAKKAIVEWLESRERGRSAVSYRLRDWLLSRQRYWGCPIPILYCDECGIVPVPEEDLPVLLPEVEEYLPKGRSPLAAAEDWVHTTCPKCGGEARRETDTMDTFVDSSWYFIRYVDPHNDEAPFDRAIADYWLPVNQYIGGDRARDPPPALRALLHEGDVRPRARRLPRSRSRGSSRRGCSITTGAKMSKSKGNVIAPTSTSSATAPKRAGSTSSSWARRSRTRNGRTRASRASFGSCGRLWRVGLEVAEAGIAGGRAGRRRSHARRTRRSRRSPTTSAPLRSSTRRSPRSWSS